MRTRWGLGLLVLLAFAGTATASHDNQTVPMTSGQAPVDEATSWVNEKALASQGCVERDGDCHVQWTKRVAYALAHVGHDPADWPDGHGPAAWLADHASDLADEDLAECRQQEDADCSDKSVFSHAKSILALQAGGYDPRDLPLEDEGSRDLVAELLDEHDGSEFGKTQQVNDDIWALLALNSVGYEGPEVTDALDRIEQAQGVDGGLGWAYGETSTVDTTASAIMAVAPHDRDAFLADARQFLADQQIDQGDKRGCWPLSTTFSGDANAESTARGLQALGALGEDPLDWSIDGQAPPGCLLRFQADEGGFRHAPGARVSLWPTQQALAALAWSPYGITEPVSTLEARDQATAGRTHTASVPSASLRIGERSVDAHEWTPEGTDQRVFHGFTFDPVRPVQLVVDVQEESSSSSSASSTQRTDDDQDETSPPSTPEAELALPGQAERNVTFTAQATGEPDQHPITAFRLQAPDLDTGWQPTGTFELALDELGPTQVTAWARDAEGHVSEPANATITLVDANPRVTIDAPATVNRNETVELTADAHDPDGPISQLTWEGPANRTANGTQATFTFPDPGPHTVTVQARDEASNTANATTTIHARNRAPLNVTVEPGQLEANATQVVQANAHDPDGDELAYAWRAPGEPEPRSWGRQLHLETGPPGQREVIVNASDPYGGWTTARLTLTVREQPDDEGTADRVNVTTHVQQPRARAPEPAASAPPTVDLPKTIQAPAGSHHPITVPADSPEGTIVNVTVALGGPLPVQGTQPARALLPALPPGSYELAARAADEAGWGPWANATLVVEPTADDEPLEPASQAQTERSTPIGGLLAATALTLAARRRRA